MGNMLIKRLDNNPYPKFREPDGCYCYFIGMCHEAGRKFAVSQSEEKIFNIPYEMIDNDTDFKYFLDTVYESAKEISGIFSIIEFRFCDNGKTKRFKDYQNNHWIENFG